MKGIFFIKSWPVFILLILLFQTGCAYNQYIKAEEDIKRQRLEQIQQTNIKKQQLEQEQMALKGQVNELNLQARALQGRINQQEKEIYNLEKTKKSLVSKNALIKERKKKELEQLKKEIAKIKQEIRVKEKTLEDMIRDAK
jgi:predicted RNase H-like nuclease (RuvC/YqgF family)